MQCKQSATFVIYIYGKNGRINITRWLAHLLIEFGRN
jgi:hypothetical protein